MQKQNVAIKENNFTNYYKNKEKENEINNSPKYYKNISTLNKKEEEEKNNIMKNNSLKSIKDKIKEEIEIKETNIKSLNSILKNSKSSIINNNYKNNNLKKINQIENKAVPYTIKTIFINLNKIYVININAAFFLKEYLIPIWFIKDTFIKFSTNGKWRLSEKYEYTDSAGLPTSNTIDFNYGALVGRIGGGPSFAILPNDFTYVTKTEGPLYLRINIPKNIIIHPEGTMEIKIYDGVIIPKEKIFGKIGGKEHNLNNLIKNISELEKDLIMTLNDLRLNPTLINEHNVKNKQNIVWTKEYLKKIYNNKDEVINNEDICNNNMTPFIPNQKCYSILDMFFNKNHNVKSRIVKNKINLFLEELEHYLTSNIKDNFKSETLVICKLTKTINHVDICIQFLLDQKIRNYIFNNSYNSIAVKVIEQYYNESHLIILAILKIK
jgi:hypothetical protein